MSDGFQFKQFYVRHDRCAMKVGTDGVLLGAMVTDPPPTPPLQGGEQNVVCSGETKYSLPAREGWGGSVGRGLFSVLDLGCGCGLIALMLAQRFAEARIVAIDIDPDAAAQARENVASSPWADRITVVEGDARISRFDNLNISQFKEDNGQIAKLSNGQMDLVVSNPPFYTNSPEAGSEERNRARRTDTLTYDELAQTAARLLRDGGHLEVILPCEQADGFIHTCWLSDLHLICRTDIRTKPNKPPKRSVLRFIKGGEKEKRSKGVKFDAPFSLLNDDGSRSAEYAALTREFYIK